MAFNDDLTWIKGRHTFKFGGMYQHAWYNGFGRQDVAGRANFSFIGTGVPGNTNFTTAGGNSFASFLLGWATDGGSTRSGTSHRNGRTSPATSRTTGASAPSSR